MYKYTISLEELPNIGKTNFKFKLDKYTRAYESARALLEENLKNNYFEQKWTQADPFYEEYSIICQIADIPYINEGWLASYEIINSFALIPETTTDEFIHFDAEGLPGEFIAAANHYKDSRCLLGDKYKWRATCLLDLEEKADRYQLYEKNKDKWLIDLSNDGDLSNIDTIKYISDNMRESADLYSACSPSCKNNIGRVVCGLLCLRAGGNLVISIDSVEKENNSSLAALVATLFEYTYLFRPQAAYNKKCVYIVAKKYKGCSPDIIKELFLLVSKEEGPAFLRPKDMMPFIKTYQDIAKKILKVDTSFIEKNIELCNNNIYDIKHRDKTEKKLEKWYILNPISL